jgi:hypothetical protein
MENNKLTIGDVLSHYRNCTFMCGGEEGTVINIGKKSTTYVSKKTMNVESCPTPLVRVILRRINDMKIEEIKQVLFMAFKEPIEDVEVTRRDATCVSAKTGGGNSFKLTVDPEFSITFSKGGSKAVENCEVAAIILYLMECGLDIFKLEKNKVAIIRR